MLRRSPLSNASGLRTNGIASACLIAAAIVAAGPALAEIKSKAQLAKEECAREAMGSSEVVVSTLGGGLIGMGLARDRYIKKCMLARGFKEVPRKKKQTEFGHNR